MKDDLENIVNVKIEVLNTLNDTFPKTVMKAFEDNYLCYFIQTETKYISVVDFTRKMPEDLDTYNRMIQESYRNIYDLTQSMQIVRREE